MKNPSLLASCTLIALLASDIAFAQDQAISLEARRGLELLVYQEGLALIRDKRWVPLTQGENRLAVTGIPQSTMDESLQVQAANGLRLLEQGRLPANLVPEQLLMRAVGKKVRLIREQPQTGRETVEEGTLLSIVGGPILRIGDRIELNPPGRIVLSDLPVGLQALPALRLVVESQNGGAGEMTLSYLTEGLDWRADYVANLSADGKSLDLEGKLSLNNATDADFEAAEIAVIAGSVARLPRQPSPPLPYAQAEVRKRGADAAAASLAEAPLPQNFGEHYFYKVPRKLSLAAGERKQLALLSLSRISVTRNYRFQGLATAGGRELVENQPANVTLSFTNPTNVDGKAGQLLPAGVIRFYEAGPQARLLFSGEAMLAQVPVGNKVTLRLGQASDLTATARQTSFLQLTERSFESSQEIVVKNAKAEAVEVEIVGEMPRGFKIQEENQRHENESANRPVWRLKVPAGGQSNLTYRVRVGGG